MIDDVETEQGPSVGRRLDAIEDALRQQGADITLCVNYVRALAQAMGAAERIRQIDREHNGTNGNGED